METITRLEAAEKIADQVNDGNDYGLSARAWSKGGHVRVYVTIEKKGRDLDNGYLDVSEEGSISVRPVSKHAVALEAICKAALTDCQVKSDEPVVATPKPQVDEDEAAHLESAQTVASGERS